MTSGTAARDQAQRPELDAQRLGTGMHWRVCLNASDLVRHVDLGGITGTMASPAGIGAAQVSVVREAGDPGQAAQQLLIHGHTAKIKS
jgi:hypothetical protein